LELVFSLAGVNKEVNENLRLLKRNLKERIIPRITQGDEDDIKIVHAIMEEFAKCLLDPTVQKLKDLNDSMSELKPILKEKVKLIPFFDRYPKLRHGFILLINGFCGFLAFYVGINFLHVSTDTAFIAGTTLFGTLTLAYINYHYNRKKPGA